MLALTGKAAAGTNRVSLGYYNPKVFQSSRRDAGAVQLVDITARVSGKKSLRASYSLKGTDFSYKAQVNGLFGLKTSNEVVGTRLNNKTMNVSGEGSAQFFSHIPCLYYTQNGLHADFQLVLPPGSKVLCSVPRFFEMLGLPGETEILPGKYGYEHPLGSDDVRRVRGKVVRPLMAVSQNTPNEDFLELRAAAPNGSVQIKFVQELDRARTGDVALAVERPLNLADVHSCLEALAGEVRDALSLRGGTLEVEKTDEFVEMYSRPVESGGGSLKLTIVFDDTARIWLNLERSTFEVNLAGAPDEDEDQTKMGVLRAFHPPSSASNAMREYTPYLVMSDSPPFDSWVSGKGTASVLAYVDLHGGMTSFLRRLSPDFNCLSLQFVNPDLTEMKFDDDLDLNVYFALT